MANKKHRPKVTRKRDHYPPALKREIAQRYIDGDFSYGAAADEYGLASKEVVREFVKWYRRLLATEDNELAERKAELAALELTPAEDPESEPPEPDLPDDPAALKRLLQDARDEAAVWRTVVRVAEEQTGLPILKKPIAKPPAR